MKRPKINLPLADQGGNFAQPGDLDQGLDFDQGGDLTRRGDLNRHHDFDQGGNLAAATDQVPIGVLADTESADGRFPLSTPATFPRRAWDPALYAAAIVAEYTATRWQQHLQPAPPPVDPNEVGAEIEILLKKAELRSSRSAEIAQQARDGSVYWSNMLMITTASHPATWDLINAANAVAHVVAMHFKRIFARPRPAQYYPGLMPPFLTPRHPSYPNAHMLESNVIAACLQLVVPGQGTPGDMKGPLFQLANRIGMNREVAGLHFPSDTEASRKLTPGIMTGLQGGPLFDALVTEARAEWNRVEVTPPPG